MIDDVPLWARRPAGREPIRFFLPGPCYVLEEVRAELTAPVVGHRSATFRELYARIAPHLPPLFGTRREVYIATGSSTLVMEAAVASAVESSVLNVTCGSFSERWHAISNSLGKEADRLAVPWGQAVDPDLLRRALARKRYEAVTLVHNETSTGVINPIAELERSGINSSLSPHQHQGATQEVLPQYIIEPRRPLARLDRNRAPRRDRNRAQRAETTRRRQGLGRGELAVELQPPHAYAEHSGRLEESGEGGGALRHTHQMGAAHGHSSG